MSTDRDRILALKRSINPIALFQSMGMGRYTIDSRGRLRAACWLHGGDNPTSFHGNLEKGRFTCHSHKCVVSADIFDVALARFGDKGVAFNFVKDFGRDWTEDERDQIDIRIKSSSDMSYEVTESMIEHYRSQDLSCWIGRGMSPTIIDRFDLGYAPNSDRAIFPLRDENGTLYGIQGRIADDTWLACGVERYKTHPPGVLKSQHVFGLYQALEMIRWERENLACPPIRDTFMIVEGNYCVVAGHQCAEQTEGTRNWRPEFEMIGSVMGSYISRHQAALISRHFTKVIVIPDWNPDTGRYAEGLVESCKQEFDGFTTVLRADMPQYDQHGDIWIKDFGDLLEYRRDVDAMRLMVDNRRYAM